MTDLTAKETCKKIARAVQEAGGSWTAKQEMEHRRQLRKRGAFKNNSHRAVTEEVVQEENNAE